jgi:hypothetical protein
MFSRVLLFRLLVTVVILLRMLFFGVFFFRMLLRVFFFRMLLRVFFFRMLLRVFFFGVTIVTTKLLDAIGDVNCGHRRVIIAHVGHHVVGPRLEAIHVHEKVTVDDRCLGIAAWFPAMTV